MNDEKIPFMVPERIYKALKKMAFPEGTGGGFTVIELDGVPIFSDDCGYEGPTLNDTMKH